MGLSSFEGVGITDYSAAAEVNPSSVDKTLHNIPSVRELSEQINQFVLTNSR